MPAIQVHQLCKTFSAKRKAAGFWGSVRALARPEWQTVEAVRHLSFEMEQGEPAPLAGPPWPNC